MQFDGPTHLRYMCQLRRWHSVSLVRACVRAGRDFCLGRGANHSDAQHLVFGTVIA